MTIITLLGENPGTADDPGRYARAGRALVTGPGARENWCVVSGAVIGRDAELDFVERFLDKVGGGPTGLVVSGEARIRKTVLWQVAVERARGRVAHVLTCRGREARVALSFAGLLELFGGLLGEATGSLLRPRRRALVLALLLAEPGERPPDAPAIAPAVHDLLGALARRVEVR